jgi:hypothetical protein
MNVQDIEEALDYLRDLAHEWDWKRNSIPKNDREMAELDELIGRLDAELHAGPVELDAVSAAYNAGLDTAYRLAKEVVGHTEEGETLLCGILSSKTRPGPEEVS